MIATVSVVHDFSSDGVITAQHCHSCADSALSQGKLILDHRLPGYVGLARELLRRFLGEQLSSCSVQSGRPWPQDTTVIRSAAMPSGHEVAHGRLGGALAEGPNCTRWFPCASELPSIRTSWFGFGLSERRGEGLMLTSLRRRSGIGRGRLGILRPSCDQEEQRLSLGKVTR